MKIFIPCIPPKGLFSCKALKHKLSQTKIYNVRKVAKYNKKNPEAFEDCGHLNSSDEIMVCINDILAATNCQVRSDDFSYCTYFK